MKPISLWDLLVNKDDYDYDYYDQHLLTPTLVHPRPNGTYNLLSVFSILLLTKATVLVRKLILCFLSIYYSAGPTT